MTKKHNKFIPLPVNATLMLGVAGMMILLAYGTYVALPYVLGPAVSVHAPKHMEDGTTILTGITKRVSKVTVNELEVPLNEDGAFSVERAYPPGYTVVIINAADRFGRRREAALSFITPKRHASEEKNDIDETGNNAEDGA